MRMSVNVTFAYSEPVAKDIKTFWFEPERPVSYIAGQFTELFLHHEKPDDRGTRRWFTLSSSPTEPLLGITTKFAATGGGTFKHELATLKPGAALKLADPMGDFVLPQDPTIPVVFIAGGMGITPVRSMVQWLQDSGDQRDIHLIYAVTNHGELAFEPLFKAYNLTYTPIVNNPTEAHKGHIGWLSADRILELAGDDGRARLYLSGPEQMVEAFHKDLKKRGIGEDRLVADYFPGYPQL